MMFVFHTTTEEASLSILAKGFRNGLGLPTLEGFEEAVWLADIPLPYGDSTLRLDLPATLLQEHELIHDEGTGPGHREFVIPAEVLNAFPVEAYELTDADEEAIRRLAEGPL